MAQWILKENGNVIQHRTLRSLNVSELYSPKEKKKREKFDALIGRIWGTSINTPTIMEAEEKWEEYEDEKEEPITIPEIEYTVNANISLINQQPAYDNLINAEVKLQLGENLQTAKVVNRASGLDGVTVGVYDDNLKLKSIVYDVKLPDGTVRYYSANIIPENMLTQVNSDGFSLTNTEGIIDYKKDEVTAMSKADMHVMTRRGQDRVQKTTSGWKFIVKWRDKTESWIHLKHLKESHPVEVAKFVRARGISDEPAFAWWVPYTIRKRDIILFY